MNDNSKGHVLVTGAALRIGREIALTLAQAGWDVTIHFNRSADAAQSLALEIKALGRYAGMAQADLADPQAVAALILSLQGPPLTALVNNASLFEHDDQDPDGSRHKAINFAAPITLSHALLGGLAADSAGAIVHILDNTSQPAILTHYAHSRHLLRETIPALATAFAPRARVNAVAVGPSLINERQSQAHFKARCAETPLGHASQPIDIAKAVLCLLENSSITGAILPVDSGLHLIST